jgi:hypothetical protein
VDNLKGNGNIWAAGQKEAESETERQKKMKGTRTEEVASVQNQIDDAKSNQSVTGPTQNPSQERLTQSLSRGSKSVGTIAFWKRGQDQTMAVNKWT